MSTKSLPERVRFFIADDIRAEGQKPMIIGFFPDDHVGVNIPANMPEPTSETPVVLQSLAILASIIGCTGAYKAKISLYLPDGSAIFENSDLGEIQPNGGGQGKSGVINFIAKFMPFHVPQFGQYKFVISLGRKKYNYEFRIGKSQLAK